MNDWLADTLRADGLRVVELDGWRTRQTRAGFTPAGVVCHHTATSKAASNESVRRLLRDGRSDLPGPLSQLGLERDGTVVVVAGGRCNHNGYGLWGNDSFGIEAYNDGVGEPWPPVQVDAYQRAVAAICRRMGWGPDRVKAHRETDPTRKIDPRGIDMAAFRSNVATLIKREDEMTPEQEAKLDKTHEDVRFVGDMVDSILRGNFRKESNKGDLTWLDEKLKPIVDRLELLEVGGVDVDALAAKVADLLANRLAD